MVVKHDDTDGHPKAELLGVAAELRAPDGEPLAILHHHEQGLERAGQHAQAALGGQREGLRADRRGPDRRMRLFERLGDDVYLGEAPELPVKREGLVAPAAAHDLQALVDARPALTHGAAEHVVLERRNPTADPDIHASVGEQVEGGDPLGDEDRVLEREQDDANGRCACGGCAG